MEQDERQWAEMFLEELWEKEQTVNELKGRARVEYEKWLEEFYASQDEPDEEYDCPIHGRLGGINFCPKC